MKFHEMMLAAINNPNSTNRFRCALWSKDDESYVFIEINDMKAQLLIDEDDDSPSIIYYPTDADLTAEWVKVVPGSKRKTKGLTFAEVIEFWKRRDYAIARRKDWIGDLWSKGICLSHYANSLGFAIDESITPCLHLIDLTANDWEIIN